jgi:aspartokinase
MEPVKINGIRLNKNYIQVIQKDIDRQDQSSVSLYQVMESNRINMVFMTLNTMGSKSFVSGTIGLKHFGQTIHRNESWEYDRSVCTLSIFPHHHSLQLLGFLLLHLGGLRLSFRHMVSSNAMLTFVVDQENCDAFTDMFSANFDLPQSHVPFEQKENDELTQFLKKKYPETRASYVEKKIKTYGITLVPDLNLSSYLFSFDQLTGFGQKIRSMEKKNLSFFHTSIHMASPEQIHLYLLTENKLSLAASETRFVDLLSFHGPHFGDRHSIVSRALNCLAKESIRVLQADCTGASISIVLPQGKGKAAKLSLIDVFDSP